jgi:hypothetical protein
MKQLMKNLAKPTLSVIVILVSLAAFYSCRVTLLPAYDSKIAEQINATSMTVDKFYLSMLETTKAENTGRAFSKFSEQYVEIEVELNSLLNQNKVRPLNENSIRICEITLQVWMKRKEEHKKDNTLSDGLIKLNQKDFNELFLAMQVAEKAKDILNHPPQE